MFIFWGRKLVYRKVGYVADFCPICRVVRPFQLMRVGSAGHIYYISAGEGILVGFERVCQECRTALQAEPEAYTSVAKRPASLEELTSTTSPDLHHVLQERLALEERVRRDPTSLTLNERQALIRSPFFLLSPKVETRFASTHFDWQIWLSIVGALCLVMAGGGLAHTIIPDQAEVALLAFMALGVALVIWQFIASGKRFMHKEIIPLLAGTLNPLRPSENEIVDVLRDLKQLRHKIASKIKPADLLTRMVA